MTLVRVASEPKYCKGEHFAIEMAIAMLLTALLICSYSMWHPYRTGSFCFSSSLDNIYINNTSQMFRPIVFLAFSAAGVTVTSGHSANFSSHKKVYRFYLYALEILPIYFYLHQVIKTNSFFKMALKKLC